MYGDIVAYTITIANPNDVTIASESAYGWGVFAGGVLLEGVDEEQLPADFVTSSQSMDKRSNQACVSPTYWLAPHEREQFRMITGTERLEPGVHRVHLAEQITWWGTHTWADPAARSPRSRPLRSPTTKAP